MKRLSVVFLVLFSIFCLSCDFSAHENTEVAKVNEDGTITVRFYLGLPSFERSVITPDYDIRINNLYDKLGVRKIVAYIDKDTEDANIHPVDYSDSDVTTRSLDINLLPGTHTIQVEAVKDDGTVMLRTENKVLTISTSTPSVNLSLKPYNDATKTGSVSIKVGFPMLASDQSDREFHIKAEIDDGVNREEDSDNKKTVTLTSGGSFTETFKISNVKPGTHHLNFTVSETSGFTSNVTLTYLVVVYSNMESSWCVSNNGASFGEAINLTVDDMTIVSNDDVKVCVAGTDGAFTSSADQSTMVTKFFDNGVSCKYVACYDTAHGGVNAALNYCKEVYPSASEWDIYIVGKVMANDTYYSADGFVDISSSDYAGKTINLIGLTDNTKDILDANSKCRVLNLESSANVNVKNLSLQNGSADYGAGIKMTTISGKLIVEDSVISGNQSGASGAGVYLYNSGTDYSTENKIINTTISANKASGSGGGLYVEKMTLVLDGCTITSNEANGSAGNGGGILAETRKDDSFSVEKCTFSGNKAPNGSGGAIKVNTGKYLTIKGGTLSTNTAKNGGAISNYGTLYLSDFDSSSKLSIPAGTGDTNDVYLGWDSSASKLHPITINGDIAGTGTVAKIYPENWVRGAVVLKAATGSLAAATIEKFKIIDTDFTIYSNGTINAPLYVAGSNYDTNIISQTGNDTTGRGTKAAPYATVTKAMAQFTTSSSTYEIKISGEVKDNPVISSVNATSIILKGINGNNKDSIKSKASSSTVLTVNKADTTVIIEKLKITGGAATAEKNGGGITITNGTVKLAGGSMITGNHSNYGGGVYVTSSGTLFMYDSALIGDSATSTTAPTGSTNAANYSVNDGGGIYNDGGKVYLGYSSYTDSATNTPSDITDGYGVKRNSDKTGGKGGGIYSTASAVTIIRSGDVSYNNCMNYGGGIAGAFEIQGGTIGGNTANYGGGLCVLTDYTAKISGGEIGVNGQPNTGTNGGGGVYISNRASLTMTGGKINFNTAKNGGAVYVGSYGGSQEGIFIFQGGTISGNEAETAGGGIYNNGILNLEGGTIGKTGEDDDWNKVTDTSGKGGAIFQKATCTMKGSIYIPFGYKEKINDVYIDYSSTESTNHGIKLTGNLTNSSSTIATINPAYDKASTPTLLTVLNQDSTESYIQNNYQKFGLIQRGNQPPYEIEKTAGTSIGKLKLNSEYVSFESDYKFNGSSTLMRGGQPSKIFIAGREITIKGMYVGKTELTQPEYEKFCFYRGTGVNYPPESNYTTGYTNEIYPVYGVCWYDMFVYCNLRSMSEGLDPVYSFVGETDPTKWPYVVISGNRYRGPNAARDDWDAIEMDKSKNGWRLPTEAEWEYIAAGGNQYDYKYCGTNEIPSGSNNGKYGWLQFSSDESEKNKPHPVKSQAVPNICGLYGMIGNVYEMCWDWYNPDIPINSEYVDLADAYVETGQIRPKRVIRGSCCTYNAQQAEVIDRSVVNNVTDRYANCGARIVRTKVTP